MKKGLCQKGRSKSQAQTSTRKTTVEERTNFKHRELSESEATLPIQEAESFQQIPPLPVQRGILYPRTVHSHRLVTGLAQEMQCVCFSCLQTF